MPNRAMSAADKAAMFDVFHEKVPEEQWTQWMGESLERAASTGDSKLVRTLLSAGASPNTVCDGGEPILHLAVKHGKEDVVRVLLGHGVSVDTRGLDDHTPLDLTALHNYPAVATLLLAGGANANLRAEWGGSTSLELATREGHVDVMAILLQNGADASCTKYDGTTILHTAADLGQVDAIRELLKAGADVDAEDWGGRTPLLVASSSNRVEAVKALCQGGADGSKTANSGWTALHFATSNGGSLELVETLLDAGAVTGQRISHNDRSALDFAAKNGYENIVRALIQRGADAKAVNSKGLTAMHDAARFNSPRAIDVLVEAGASPNTANSNGWTPLHIASACHCTGAVRALLNNGAVVNVRNKRGQLPLHCAASRSRGDSGAEVVKILLRWDADETAVDASGRTPAEVEGKEGLFIGMGPNERLIRLLANAPADRAWRRRGFLVMCRALPDRARPRSESDETPARGMMTRRRAKAARIDMESRNGGVGGAGAGVAGHATAACDIGNLVAKVVNMKQEDIFQRILAFL